MKNSYRTQIRNAIAHSKYSFNGRNIHLHNSIKEDPHSSLSNLKFDDWIDVFHDVMVIYNLTIYFFNKVGDHYTKKARENGLQQEVRLKRNDPKMSTEYKVLEYIPNSGRWVWYRND